MARYQSLCEYLAEAGGIRLTRRATMFAAGGPVALTHGASDLLAMAADRWHRERPFRKKLVRDLAGRPLDDMCETAREGGYFYERPSTTDLLASIERELGGRPVYTPEDEAAMYEAAEREAIVAESTTLADAGAKPATATSVVTMYEQPYVNRKGRPGVTYYAKVVTPGAQKPVLHKSFLSAAERDTGVQAFLATRAAQSCAAPF